MTAIADKVSDLAGRSNYNALTLTSAIAAQKTTNVQ